jgi:N-acetylglucosamine-6-phosphate deacetylase
MRILSGARIVTEAAVLDPGTLVVEGDCITEVQPGRRSGGHELHGHLIVPGFVDVHVHGVGGADVLATEDGVAAVAAVLPRYGVTAFCPTSVACGPSDLRRFLASVSAARRERRSSAARVLAAHLESNFINPDFCGAQPRECLRQPSARPGQTVRGSGDGGDTFTPDDVLREIDTARDAVGIVTLAPELPGALQLISRLAGAGLRVSLGHSGASYEEGLAGVDAGARHATHLFNRMPPFSHREPGLVGAIFERDQVSAELIVDGYHVHPAAGRAALRALGMDRGVAITDGTAASGLPEGAVVRLGSQTITAGPQVALLGDGTWAGSLLTMDRAFRNLVRLFGCGLAEAARLCSTNPARALGTPFGVIRPGAPADFVVLDGGLEVVQTFVAGAPVFARGD